MKAALTLLAVLCVSGIFARPRQHRVTYHGYQVLELIPSDKTQLDFIRTLIQEGFDVEGAGTGHVGSRVQITVPPQKFRNVQYRMTLVHLKYHVLIRDLQVVLDEEYKMMDERAASKDFQLLKWNDLATIEAQLDKWVTSCSSKGLDCEKYSIGKTYEKRELWVLKVAKSGTKHPIIWMDSLIHAREWLAGSTNLNIIDKVINGVGSDSDVDAMLAKYEFRFMPVLNPDGYDYSWGPNRMWRKNRSPSHISGCPGADLNRNFDCKWGGEGISNNPCSELYAGKSAASELETQAVQDEGKRLAEAQGITAWVTFHTFGEMWMFPWGYTYDHAGRQCVRSSDYADLMKVATATADAIQNTHNIKRWKRGTSCEVIYPTTGGTDDWAKGNADVKYAFNPELRGPHFIVSESNIKPGFEETWNGVIAMVKTINEIEG